jgi:hypothetical protein
LCIEHLKPLSLGDTMMVARIRLRMDEPEAGWKITKPRLDKLSKEARRNILGQAALVARLHLKEEPKLASDIYCASRTDMAKGLTRVDNTGAPADSADLTCFTLISALNRDLDKDPACMQMLVNFAQALHARNPNLDFWCGSREVSASALEIGREDLALRLFPILCESLTWPTTAPSLKNFRLIHMAKLVPIAEAHGAKRYAALLQEWLSKHPQSLAHS